MSFASQTKTTLIEDGFQPVFVNGDKILVANGIDEPDTCVVSVKYKKATISTNLKGPLNAVYPAKAARMDEQNLKAIGGVLVSTEQDGTFASANICMAKNISEDTKEVTFVNKTALFRIIPVVGAQYVEVRADGYDIANYFTDESEYKDDKLIHVEPITADTVYVSILVPPGLTVGNLTFSDGTNEKTVTGDKASTEIARGTLYTVTNENWKSPEADIPDGALKGVFSVSADKQVYFSQGNLYAKNEGSLDSPDWKWHFYDEQYKYNSISTGSSRTAADTDIEIDLFTWGYNATNSVNPIGTEYVSGHDTEGNKQLNPSTGGDDWGVAYCGSNGIDVGTWRTLSTEEWQYLFNYGSYTSEVRNGKYKYGVTVCSKANCVVLLPDNWDGTVISLPNFAAQNTYDESSNPKWSEMEAAGAVCLPAAGCRSSSIVNFVGSNGYYWSSSAYGSYYAYYVDFYSSYVNPVDIDYRYFGSSVRLVTNVSAAPTPAPTEPDYVVMKANVEGTKTLKWATKNHGAKTIAGNLSTCAGDYYQWGSLDKLYSSIIWTDNTTGSFVGLKEGGFAETNLTYKENADLSDATNDVVKKTYPGTNWRMPTKQEFQDLYDACVGTDGYDNTTKPTTGKPTSNGVYWCDSYDGVAGVLFYDGTNVLFFPAAGTGYGTSLYYAGSSGGYWSSSLYTGNTDDACILGFGSSGVNPQSYGIRYYGFSVRPVSD